MIVDITMWNTNTVIKGRVYQLKVGKLQNVVATYAIGDYVPYTHSDYSFGYNGMEIDPEQKGAGNSYTTEFRQYDPRLGRWMSLDPLMASFPGQSAYMAFDGNPVVLTDPSGLKSEGWIGTKDENGKVYYVHSDEINTAEQAKAANIEYFISDEDQMRRGTATYPNGVTTGVGDVFIHGDGSLEHYADYDNVVVTADRVTPIETAEEDNSIMTQFMGDVEEKHHVDWSPSSNMTSFQRSMDKFCNRAPLALPIGAAVLFSGGAAGAWMATSTTVAGVTTWGAGIYSGAADATLFSYLTAESAAVSTVNFASRYWLGRLALTGGSLYSGYNLYNLRAGGTPMPYKYTTAPVQKAIFKPSFLKVNDRYIDGFYNDRIRFQIHQHSIDGSPKVPHINFGTNGSWHLMLNKEGAKVNGWLWKVK